MNIHWQRVLRLTALGSIIAILTLLTGLAWRYVHALTLPDCPPLPEPITSTHHPVLIVLKTSDGLSLPSRYYPSKNGAAVIVLGGQTGSLRGGLPPIQPLISNGYGVLQIDSRVCADPPTHVTLGYHEVQDVAAALVFLKSRAEVNPARIAAFGFSMGGVTAIRAAARHPEIKAVIAEGGYYNLGDDIVDWDRPVALYKRMFLFAVAGVFWIQTGINPWHSSPIDDLPRITPRPILLIYGEHEVEEGRALVQYQAAHQPKVLWIVEGGNHGNNHVIAHQEYNQRVIHFLEQAIGG